jgi:hypothetical protein
MPHIQRLAHDIIPVAHLPVISHDTRSSPYRYSLLDLGPRSRFSFRWLKIQGYYCSLVDCLCGEKTDEAVPA